MPVKYLEQPPMYSLPSFVVPSLTATHSSTLPSSSQLAMLNSLALIGLSAPSSAETEGKETEVKS